MNTIETLKAQILDIENQISVKKSEIETAQNAVNNFEYSISDDKFDEILDADGIQQTSVGAFYPSDILKSCDPVAYRCAKSDYEGNYDLDDCNEYVELNDTLETLQDELSDLESDLETLEDELNSLESD